MISRIVHLYSTQRNKDRLVFFLQADLQ